jgi:hypothetical protein
MSAYKIQKPENYPKDRIQPPLRFSGYYMASIKILVVIAILQRSTTSGLDWLKTPERSGRKNNLNHKRGEGPSDVIPIIHDNSFCGPSKRFM